MKNIVSKLVAVSLLVSLLTGTAVARECTTCKRSNATTTHIRAKAASCKRAQSTAELNVNNVRALINGYGNMWYDGSISQYHLPKNSTSTPMYCAALWIGGTDVNDQLRIAALRFGQDGDDYWPGPLTIDGAATVTTEVCNYYDRHWKITQQDVRNFMSKFNYPTAEELTSGAVPTLKDGESLDDIAQVIKEWPAHGAFENQSHYLAPFYDADGDGEYNYQNGDYPYYDFDNALCPRTLKAALAPGENYVPRPTMEEEHGIVKSSLLSDQVLKGDQTIWWVFNDVGNVHTESQGNAIGMEIRAQAFAFSTNDEINNMTFYTYEIINRSTYELRNAYFSQWVDPDLGYAQDDYVGCDVKRGLGYCYNGKEVDGPGTGAYTGVPPAVGIDFFQGPYMDPDGKDNPRIDINKMKLYYPAQLQEYVIGTDASGRTIYDTIKLNDHADQFYGNNGQGSAWYFQPGDSVGNCAINGVNFGNNIIDDERFGMRRFVYYNNDGTANNGEPNKATDYYNYLQGKWRNNQRMKFGGNGLSGGEVSDVNCDFMFPGNSDPLHWGTNGVIPDEKYHPNDWSEVTVGKNQPGDRRFMQSAGPFTLKAGALNYITVGIPFAQGSSNAWSSVEELRTIDDVCQNLFENCFAVLDGPDAPTMVAQELSNEIILYLTYENPSSNNYNEKYEQEDLSIPEGYQWNKDTVINGDTTTVPKFTYYDRKYRFEGYQIFQLVNAKASIADITDETKARLVAQCDIKNFYDDTIDSPTLPIGTLVNYTTESTTGLITGRVMVEGSNNGIQHVFHITNDAFATGNNTSLVNNKEYYFIAIAYAHNRFKEYSQTEEAYLKGQKEPYLSGRKNEKGGTITSIVVKPHNPRSENGGTKVQAEFGISPNITRIEGYGNGGGILKLTQESIEELMGKPGEVAKVPGTFDGFKMNEPCIIAHPRYEQNAGPINVRVIDPLNVKPGQFYIAFDGVNDTTSRWTISRVDGKPLYDNVYTDTADFVIGRYNEQLFLDLGIAVSIENTTPVAAKFGFGNYLALPSPTQGVMSESSLLSSNMTFGEATKTWLSGVHDADAFLIQNWIRSGSQFSQSAVSSFISSNKPVGQVYPNDETYLDGDYYRFGLDNSNRVISVGVDKSQTYEGVVSGMWAPYGLASAREYHPAFSLQYYFADTTTVKQLRSTSSVQFKPYYQALRETYNYTTLSGFSNKSIIYNDLNNLPSVHIVITSDTSKWTRCPVLEMCDDYTQSEGNARRFQMRKHLSIDKNGKTIEDLGVAANVNDPGNPAYIEAEGMGWFPGYVINLATGERLNMMYGEDSRYAQYHGRDMMWNPVSTLLDGTQNYVIGGRHFIYIMNAGKTRYADLSNVHSTSAVLTEFTSPSYDAGKWSVKWLRSLDRMLALKKTSDGFYNGLLPLLSDKLIIPQRDSSMYFFSTVAWVNMPMVSPRFAFTNPQDIPTDVTIDINVKTPYGNNWSPNGSNPRNVAGMSVTNKNNPLYMFELTDDIATLTGLYANANASQDYKDSILSDITVVPNPYYSYSTYETSSQLETKVRFVNVPARSVISIYTLDGTLVRRLGPTPDNTTTVDWDLHNHNGLPIAGGVYLCHFDCPNVGERVVKWFGTMRPVDLNSFKF